MTYVCNPSRGKAGTWSCMSARLSWLTSPIPMRGKKSGRLLKGWPHLCTHTQTYTQRHAHTTHTVLLRSSDTLYGRVKLTRFQDIGYICIWIWYIFIYAVIWRSNPGEELNTQRWHAKNAYHDNIKAIKMTSWCRQIGTVNGRGHRWDSNRGSYVVNMLWTSLEKNHFLLLRSLHCIAGQRAVN